MNKRKIVSYIIDAILVLIIALLGYVQISMIVSRNDKSNYGVPSAFGKSFLYVATNSMDDGTDNCLAPGTGIIIDKVNMKSFKLCTPIIEDEKIVGYQDDGSIKPSTPIYDEEGKIKDYKKDGDIVTFFLANPGVPDTHRVIDIYYDEEVSSYIFTTLGDRDDLHEKLEKDIPWKQDKLIGKVVYHSKALGSFLAIASPEAAASAGQMAWFFPVAIIIPIFLLAGFYMYDAIKKYRIENKIREEKIQAAIKEAGIDENDEEAMELMRMKVEMRLDFQEEYERTKEKLKKEMLKKKKNNEKK